MVGNMKDEQICTIRAFVRWGRLNRRPRRRGSIVRCSWRITAHALHTISTSLRRVVTTRTLLILLLLPMHTGSTSAVWALASVVTPCP